MRKFIFTLILFVSVAGLATAQSFGSTGSDIMNTGSTYSSTVSGVGATGVDPMYGTTASGPMRRSVTPDSGDDDTEHPSIMGDVGQVPEPIGAPYILLLFAAGAAGVVALRRRRSANS